LKKLSILYCAMADSNSGNSGTIEQFIKDELEPELSLCCECGETDYGEWDNANNRYYCEHCWLVYLKKNPVIRRKHKIPETHPDRCVKSSVEERSLNGRRIASITSVSKGVWGITVPNTVIAEILLYCCIEKGMSLQWVGAGNDPAVPLPRPIRKADRIQFLVSFMVPRTVLRMKMTWHFKRHLNVDFPSYKIPLAKNVKIEARFYKGSKRSRKIWVPLWEGVPTTDWKHVQHEQFTSSVQANFFPMLSSVAVLRITCIPKFIECELVSANEVNLEKHLKYATFTVVSD